MEKFLYEKLIDYTKTDVYPFHMPGHKRASISEEKTYSIDITEIDGFDNLQNPKEVILDMENFAAQLYGTKHSFFLVNGSSAGLLAAISAVCGYGETILVSRNCHKSVFNAIALRGLRTVYLYPEVCTEFGISGGITPEMVKNELNKHPEIKAVLITSPTYDGVVSDIAGIAREVHKYGIPLIVDEAHGAHFQFSAGLFPKSALKCGADIVIQSLHKTLPAFTQTGILHLNSDRIEKERMRKFLNIYQSTSPSYILMAGIGKCLEWLNEDGRSAFEKYEKELVFWRKRYAETLSGVGKIKLMGREVVGKNGIFDIDESKILFGTDCDVMSGRELSDIFRSNYGLEMEMATKDYCLALSSVFDREEGFKRLGEALEALEGHFKDGVTDLHKEKSKENCKRNYQENYQGESPVLWMESTVSKPEAVMTFGEVLDLEAEWVCLDDAEGKICGDYVFLYPPGIPMLLPGERINRQMVEFIRKYMAYGFELDGVVNEKIKVF